MIESCLILHLLTASFVQKWWFPQGLSEGSTGRMCIEDTDRDRSYELIFSTYGGSYTIYIYELHLPSTWQIDSISNLAQPLLWDSGDFDLDGLHDMVMQSSWGAPMLGISVYESPDSFSYPTQEVWRDTVDIGTVQPICAWDMDKDAYPEIVQTGGEAGTNYYIDFSIYEYLADNAYEVIYQYESPETPTSTVAFGDFDGDSLTEFVLGTIDGQYSIFECTGNNSYTPLQENVQLPTVNIKDCFTVPDADQDGKPEFVVKGFYVGGPINAFIFEATGDNTYEIIKSFTLPGGDYDGGYSDAGDVDGDSVAKIVLEARQNVFVIKAAGNDSFYIWDTLPGHASGSCVRVTNDIDGNGLNEVVISGNNETRIYEYDAGGIKENTLRSTHYALHMEVYPSPFFDRVTIKFQILNPVHQAITKSKSTVKIYDIGGRLVKDFHESVLNDKNMIYWNGKDESERLVPQGIYFCQLEANGYSETKKIIKTK